MPARSRHCKWANAPRDPLDPGSGRSLVGEGEEQEVTASGPRARKPARTSPTRSGGRPEKGSMMMRIRVQGSGVVATLGLLGLCLTTVAGCGDEMPDGAGG